MDLSFVFSILVSEFEERVAAATLASSPFLISGTIFENGIDACFAYKKNQAYLFKGENYVLMNYTPDSTYNTLVDVVKPIADSWSSLRDILPFNDTSEDIGPAHVLGIGVSFILFLSKVQSLCYLQTFHASTSTQSCRCPFKIGAFCSDDQQCATAPERPPPPTSSMAAAERGPRPKIESLPKKVAIEFGESGTCDTKVILLGKQGFCVKLSVHRNVLTENI
ncbi:hypothetical protein VNO80_06572 [Phaseolus coccineus]|uniref:Uncharacterized protein n=1 Tax=Phaseolus coccineus TaxID=3886 RepID=A0AAN9RIU7_PHACN